MRAHTVVKYVGLAFLGWFCSMEDRCSLHATTVVTYTFVSATGDPSSVSTDLVSAATATLGYTSSSVFGFSSSSNSSTGTSGSFFSRLASSASNPSWTAPSTLTSATAAGTYLEFSITPTNGTTLDLTTLNMDVFAQTLSGGSSYADYTAYYNLQVTVNGVTSDLGTSSYTTTITTQGAKYYDTQNLVFSLSSLSDLTTTATFRLTMYVTGSSNYFETIRVDNIYLNASAIPELPISLYVFLGACAYLVLYPRITSFTRIAPLLK